MRKRKLSYYLLSLIMGSTGMVSCGGDSNRLSRDKMVGVLHDIQLAEAIYQAKYNDFNSKEEKDALLQGILAKHSITQAQLDSSLVWYADNAEIYMKVNDSVISSLRAGLVKVEKLLPKNGAFNRNNSVLPTYYYLSGDVPLLTFSIDSVLAKSYPQFSLEFNTLGLQREMNGELEVRFEYADTTIIKNEALTADNHFKILGETLPLKSISGYFYIEPNKILNNKVFLYNILLKNVETANDSLNTTQQEIPQSVAK